MPCQEKKYYYRYKGTKGCQGTKDWIKSFDDHRVHRTVKCSAASKPVSFKIISVRLAQWQKFSWDHEDLDHDGLNRWAHGILRESDPSDDLDPVGRLTGIANEGTDG